MNIVHPEILATLERAGVANPQLGPWQSLHVCRDGSAQAHFQHGIVRFQPDGFVIEPGPESAFAQMLAAAKAKKEAKV